MNYDVILFDADGTLFDYDMSEGFALESAFLQYGLDFSNEITEVYRPMNSKLWLELEKGLISRNELQEKRFTQLFSALDIAGISPGEFNREYLGWLGKGYFLIDGALEICSLLKGKARMAIVTNGIASTQMTRIGGSELNDMFEHIFVSEEIGYTKPDVRFFDNVLLHMHKCEGERYLIVGDSLTSDIQGGINTGIDTCWYNPQGLSNEADIKTDYEIRRLSELAEIAGLAEIRQ